MQITLDLLRAKQACPEGLAWFEEHVVACAELHGTLAHGTLQIVSAPEKGAVTDAR